MNFAQHPNSRVSRHLPGITFVVLAHLALGYALINGLAFKVSNVLKKPLDVSIAEEVKPLPPPPPPKIVAPPPPRAIVPPPPDYVPPPDVRIETPAPPPVIVATTPVPAPVAEPIHVPEPPPHVEVVAPAPPPPVAVGIACPNHMDVRRNVTYPSQAQRMGLNGDVLVEFTVSASGDIERPTIVKSSNAVFNTAVTNAVGQFHCVGQGHEVRVRVPFAFRLDS